MEEVKVSVAVLKAAIQNVDIPGFKTELEKITSVTDLTEHEWSDLVSISIATIKCDVLKKLRKKDEKQIFTLLLRKLVSLSSAKEKFRLTGKGLGACQVLLWNHSDDYGLGDLLTSIKNEEGYSLRYFLGNCGPTDIHTSNLSVNQDNIISHFKNGEICFKKLCEKIMVVECDFLYRRETKRYIDHSLLKFLITEFGEDFSSSIFKALANSGLLNYPHLLSEVLEGIANNKPMLNDCYTEFLISFDSFSQFFCQLELAGSGGTELYPEEQWIRLGNNLKGFSLLLERGVDPLLKVANGKSLRDEVLQLKKRLQGLLEVDAFGRVPQTPCVSEVKLLLEQLSKRINSGLVVALGVFRHRNGGCKDIQKIIGGYVRQALHFNYPRPRP